jgi:hypothetical protein
MRRTYMHFERLATTATALQTFGENIRTLEDLPNLYGDQGWELVHVERQSPSHVELVFAQNS